jgi:excisionase family DNA binding protein
MKDEVRKQVKKAGNRLDSYKDALHEQGLLTSAEAAEYLKLTQEQVHTLNNKRNLPHYKIGSKICGYKKEELDQWLEKTGYNVGSYKVALQEQGLLTTDEVAEYLKLTQEQIYRLKDKKGLPYHKIGPRLCGYKKEELDQWLEKTSNVSCSNKDVLHKKGLLTTAEAAEYLKLSKGYIFILRKTRNLPHYKIRANVCGYKKEELDQWLEKTNNVCGLYKEIVHKQGLLTTAEAAEYLKVTQDQIYRLNNARGLPHYKIGSKICGYKKEELDQWLKKIKASTYKKMAHKQCFLTTDEAAKYLNITYSYVYFLRKNKNLPHHMITPKKYGYRKDELDKWRRNKLFLPTRKRAEVYYTLTDKKITDP